MCPIHFPCHITESKNIDYYEKYTSSYTDQNLPKELKENFPEIILEKIALKPNF